MPKVELTHSQINELKMCVRAGIHHSRTRADSGRLLASARLALRLEHGTGFGWRRQVVRSSGRKDGQKALVELQRRRPERSGNGGKFGGLNSARPGLHG